MSEILLPPKKRLAKPRPWRVRRRLIPPEWRWAWAHRRGYPLWEGAGSTLRGYGSEGGDGDFGSTAPVWSVGRYGRQITFSGTEDDYVVFPNVSYASNEIIAVEALFRLDASAQDEAGIIGSVDTFEIVLRRNAGELEFILNSFSSNDRAAGGTVSDGQWHHGVGQYDGTDLTVWLDGEQVASVTPSGSYSAQDGLGRGNIRVESIGPTSGRFGGDMAMVGFHRTVPLTGSEIRRRATDAFAWVRPADRLVISVADTGTTLSPDSLSHAQALDATTVTQDHQLQPDALDQSHALDTTALDQTHVLTADDVAQTQSLETAALDQTHVLSADDVAHAQSLDDTAIAQGHVLAPDAIDHAQALDQTTVTEEGALAPDSLSHAQSLDEAALTQDHQLAPDALDHTHELESTGLGQEVTISPDDLAHGQTLGSPGMTQVHALAAAPLTHAQSLEAAAMVQVHVLSPDELSHVQVLSQVGTGFQELHLALSISQPLGMDTEVSQPLDLGTSVDQPLGMNVDIAPDED